MIFEEQEQQYMISTSLSKVKKSIPHNKFAAIFLPLAHLVSLAGQ